MFHAIRSQKQLNNQQNKGDAVNRPVHQNPTIVFCDALVALKVSFSFSRLT
jgi:hypothetical protein